MGNKYRLEIYPKAEKDLEDILYYVSQELKNVTAAQNLLVDFENAFTHVCMFPSSGSKIRNNLVKDKTLRKIIVKKYIAFYKTNDNEKTISIVRVIYGKSNWETIL